MTKINLHSVIFFLLISISCETPQNKDVEIKKEKTFIFPKVIDPLVGKEIKFASESWINYGDHNPYYFGKTSDTINVERSIRPFKPRLISPGDDTMKVTSEIQKGKYDNYFLDWMDRRDFKDRDSVKLLIKFDTTQFINNNRRKSFPVIIQNKSNDTIYIGYGDQIPIITEGKTKNGEWKPIEKRYIYGCGVGLHLIILPPNEVVVTSELVYSGNFKTKLRIRMGDSYSDEFNGEINLSQFESKYDYKGSSVEDIKNIFPKLKAKEFSLIKRQIISNESDSLLIQFPPYKLLHLSCNSHYERLLSLKINESALFYYNLSIVTNNKTVKLDYYVHEIKTKDKIYKDLIRKVQRFRCFSIEGKARFVFVPIYIEYNKIGFLKVSKKQYLDFFDSVTC